MSEGALDNVAVFLNGQRKFKNVNVEWDDTTVRLTTRNNGKVMAEFAVEEWAADYSDQGKRSGISFDIVDNRGSRQRITIQKGCGCSGMYNYDLSPDYSGALGDRK